MARSALFPIPPLFPLFFPLFLCVEGACLLRNLGAHGWVFPGICAVQDVSGTQSSLSDAFVEQDLPSRTSIKMAEHGLDPTLKNAHFQKLMIFIIPSSVYSSSPYSSSSSVYKNVKRVNLFEMQL